jgi:hypothetical protein
MAQRREGTDRSIANALLRLSCLVLALLLSACAGQDPAVRRDVPHRVPLGPGYAPAEPEAVTTITQRWQLQEGSVGVVLSKPSLRAALPLVVYLPGLGEPSEAGERWRLAWAADGYAVLAVQPLVDDATAWSSELARSGEFKALARERFGDAATSRRVHALGEVVSEARRRALAGEAGWDRIDWDRVAIAGFDLGAYTALAQAGEQVRDAGETAVRLRLRAVVALSPYASVSAGATDPRYAGIGVPVLSVTSDADGDPAGLLEGTSLRQVPFDRMAGPDKFLLLMAGLSHANLSGTAAADRHRQEAPVGKRSPVADPGTGSDDSGKRSRGKRKSSGDTGGAETKRDVEVEGRTDFGLSAADAQTQLRAAQDVSRAFLDSYLKDDPRAHEWLFAKAALWLGDSGELRRK